MDINNNNNLENKEEEDTQTSCIIKNWDDLDIPIKLLRGIFAYGYDSLSPIQQKAIKPIIDGRDIIAQAQSGTGKTATFTIGALASIDLSNQNTQVLILSPTRELALQTSKVIKGLGDMMDGLKVATYVGGINLEEGNNFTNKNTPHIICGCPGRVYDMICRNRINTRYIKLLILDEADEMLSFGFKDQVYNIFQYLNQDIQVALFSATIPVHINNIINKIMRNPVRICVQKEELSLEGIKQYYVACDDDKQKYEILKNIFSNICVSQCIIYCNSVKRVQDLYEAMIEDNFPVCRIHSSMDKIERDKAFNDFKKGGSRVLISSNITARGIDIQQVSIVINFDLPKCVHTYLHRIGRSGRWGRKGIGINFITRRDINNMKKIEEHYSINISELPDNIEFLQSF
jgi:superfamily II DNA/RNA helicase